MSRKQAALTLAVAFFLFPVPALAASTSPNAGGISLLLAAGIAYLTRRRPIGGWLFYYYLQLYGSVLFSLLLSALIVEKLRPAGWHSSTLHALFVLTVVLPLIVKAFELFLATRLLFRSQRNAKNLAYLRYVLIASVAVAVGGLAIDSAYFPQNIPLDVFSLIFTGIWCIYFFVSRRVKYVFVVSPTAWTYEVFQAAR